MPRLRQAPAKPEQNENEPDKPFEVAPEGEQPEVFEQKAPEVVKLEEPPANEALQRQLKALQDSEKLQQERVDQAVRNQEEARREARERAQEVLRLRKENVQSQSDSIETALAAAQAEVASAKRDIKLGIQSDDADAQADAYERLSKAQANIAKLEDGKFDVEQRLKELPDKIEERVQTDPVEAQIAHLPPLAQNWIRKHPEYMTNPRMNARIQSWHYDALEEGHPAFSQEYIDYMDLKAGFKEAPKVEDDDVEEPVKPGNISAPVSREAPSTGTRRNGKITLNPEQREIAKAAGISEVEYTKQLQKMQEMKANGHYGETR